MTSQSDSVSPSNSASPSSAYLLDDLVMNWESSSNSSSISSSISTSPSASLSPSLPPPVQSLYSFRTIGTESSGCEADIYCDGVEDNIEIQAEIDRLVALPGILIKRPDGTVYTGAIAGHELHLLRGVYNITQTINVKSIVNIILAPGAIINMMTDVDAINLKSGSSIKGGMITAMAHPTYSHSFIKIDGSEHIFTGTGQPMMSISDIYLLGSHFGYIGNGIHFLSDELDEMGYIYGVNVSNVCSQYLENVIKLEVQHYPTMDNWIRDCLFHNIVMRTPKNGITILTPEDFAWQSVGICNNIFDGIHIQAGSGTKRGIYCRGSVNSFRDVVVWDMPQNPNDPNYLVEFGIMTSGNHVIGQIGGANEVLDRSRNNTFDFWRWP